MNKENLFFILELVVAIPIKVWFMVILCFLAIALVLYLIPSSASSFISILLLALLRRRER